MLTRWIDQKILHEVYTLRAKTIVLGPPNKPKDTIALDDVRSWKVIWIMSIDVVRFQFADGTTKEWTDKYNDLLDILREQAPERELQWEAI